MSGKQRRYISIFQDNTTSNMSSEEDTFRTATEGEEKEFQNKMQSNNNQVASFPYEETVRPESFRTSFDFSKSQREREKRRKWCFWILFISLFLASLAAALAPLLVIFIRDNNISTDDNETISLKQPLSTSKPGPTDDSDNNTYTNKGSGVMVPGYAKNTRLDPDTWLDKKDFNLTFTNETVGGLPIMGLNSTWNDKTRPNRYVPPLNEPFKYGERPIRGVNLGGWLILEPFITPSFFKPYDNSEKKDTPTMVVDEWTLYEELNKTSAQKSKKLFETHYSSFVTEHTFKEIAEAGLDHVRIPFGYWAVKTFEGDNFLEGVSWRYLLRAIEWARKYGLRINLDLHSVPGGQNGWNHSGKQGEAKWLNGGTFGNQTLEIHQQLAKFFAQDRYKNVVTIYGLVNEPNLMVLHKNLVIDWTQEAYKIVRDQGFQNHIVYADGFLGANNWKDVFPQDEYPKLIMDLHHYTIFDQSLIQFSHGDKMRFICDAVGDQLRTSTNKHTGHGPTMIGEWSQADNDCTLYLNNVGTGTRWEGTFDPGNGDGAILTPSCADERHNCTCVESNQHPYNYTAQYRSYLRSFAEAQMDTYESNGGWGFMYWTWDTEDWNSVQWSYRKARFVGLMPQLAYSRSFTCRKPIPDYQAFGLPESY